MQDEATEELHKSVSHLRSLSIQASRGREGLLALYVEISELSHVLLQVHVFLQASKIVVLTGKLSCVCAGSVTRAQAGPIASGAAGAGQRPTAIGGGGSCPRPGDHKAAHLLPSTVRTLAP